jgi:hypothetical protein
MKLMTWLIAVYAEKYLKSLLSVVTMLVLAVVPDVANNGILVNISTLLDIIVRIFQIVASMFAIIVAIITIKSYLEKRKQTPPKKRKTK